MSALKLEGVSRSFGPLTVFQDLSLIIQPGEFVAIVGPSGCGKTTLLNLLSGHDQPSAGAISRNGHIRMVYQKDGLFPWQTVCENIALGIRHVKDESARKREIGELVQLIRLAGFENHYPHQLSGGMRQRVELARALAGKSDILLLDEPFSALDYLTRLRMRHEIARILAQQPRTVVLVTHDIEEAAQLADRIIVLSGRPARFSFEHKVGPQRPRDPTDAEVVRAIHLVLNELGVGSAAGEYAAG